MRTLFLFFLLLNAAYFYTQSDFFKDQKGPLILKPETLPKGVERLTLLRERGLGISSSKEVEKQVVTSPAETTGPNTEVEMPGSGAKNAPDIMSAAETEKSNPDTPTPPAESQCFTLGPFVQASTAGRTAEAISELGVTVNRRQTTQRKPRGYWVYLPEFKTYDAARKRVAELQKKGLKDLFIMGKGEHQNAVSLGLYKSRTTAQERYEQVKKMGLSVEMETQYHETKLAWLDMEVPADQASAITEITDMAKKIPKTTLVQRKCK